MNRRILLLNLALLALLGSLGWMIRARWMDARASEQKVLAKAPRRTELVPPPSLPLPVAADPAGYDEVARKTLFSKDRDPNPINDPPPPPPAPKAEEPPPPRPVYYGQMALDPTAPVAVLGVDRKPQKGYHVGDTVGAFKLVAFDREKLTFEWNGKTLEYGVDELKPKPGVNAPVAQVAAPQNSPSPTAIGNTAIALDTAPKDTGPVKIGPPTGNVRGCDPTDRSPAGTVADGHRKVMTPGLIGTNCYWEPIK